MENSKVPATLPQLLKTEEYQKRLAELLGKNSAEFTTTLLSIYKDSDRLKKCDPKSIITAAVTAAVLKLSILPQFGYAYIVPYGDNAIFQLGYKGLIQLAMRSGLYKNLNTTEVYEGQIKSVDFITGEIVRGEKISDKVVGYVAYMKLLNGFEKMLYMSKEEMEQHALKYSDSYRADKRKTYSNWAKNFDAMAKKTILKKLLSTYAPMSIEMQNTELATAIKADQAVIYKDTYTYVDNSGQDVPENFAQDSTPLDTVDIESGEVLAQETDPFVTGDD